MKVKSEEPNFLFSYNITSIKLSDRATGTQP